MSSRRKRRRAPWTITPADLPTERALAVEPRLNDLENNAIFRLFTMRRGQNTNFGGNTLFWVVVFISLFFTLNLIGLLLFIVIHMISTRYRPSIRQMTLLDLPRERLAELSLTLMRPEDYVIGIWGTHESRRGHYLRTCMLILLIIATASGYLWLWPSLHPICALMLFVFFSFGGWSRCYPYDHLISIRLRIAAERRKFERAVRRTAAVEFLGEILDWCYLLLLILVITILITATIIGVWNIIDEYRLFPYLRHPLVGLVASLTGWLLGRFIGHIIKVNAKADFRDAAAHVRAILRLQQEP